MSKIVVKFTKGWSKYNAKDIAGFEAAVAEDLIKVKKSRAIAQRWGC